VTDGKFFIAQIMFFSHKKSLNVKICNKKISYFSSRNQYFPHIPYVASKNGRLILTLKKISTSLVTYLVTASFEFAARTAAYSATLAGIILATILAPNFADAETVNAVPVDLVTTTET
jgi:hypothetical protein